MNVAMITTFYDFKKQYANTGVKSTTSYTVPGYYGHSRTKNNRFYGLSTKSPVWTNYKFSWRKMVKAVSLRVDFFYFEHLKNKILEENWKYVVYTLYTWQRSKDLPLKIQTHWNSSVNYFQNVVNYLMGWSLPEVYNKTKLQQ